MPETLILPDLDVLDVAALKALARAQHKQSQAQQDLIKAQQEQYLASLSSRASEIAHLKLLLDKLQRMLFGARSEKLVRQVAQLELQLEELETSRGEEEVSAHLPFPTETQQEPKQSSRRTLPEHLPREIETHRPETSCCPGCGGALREFGEDVSLRSLSMCPRASRSSVTCGRSSVVAAVRRWSKRLRRRGPFRVLMPDLVCSPMYWLRSTAITRSSTGSSRSTPARVSTLIDPLSAAGLEIQEMCSGPW